MRVLTEPKNALVKQYQKLFEMEDAELEFTDDALTAIAAKAPTKDTGARGLRSIVEEVMLDIMFELPDQPKGSKYVIDEDVVHGRKQLFPVHGEQTLKSAVTVGQVSYNLPRQSLEWIGPQPGPELRLRSRAVFAFADVSRTIYSRDSSVTFALPLSSRIYIDGRVIPDLTMSLAAFALILIARVSPPPLPPKPPSTATSASPTRRMPGAWPARSRPTA